MWRYSTASNIWTWVHGPNTFNQLGWRKEKKKNTTVFGCLLTVALKESMALKEQALKAPLLDPEKVLVNGLLLMESFVCLEEVDIQILPQVNLRFYVCEKKLKQKNV
jgi:hypothetical protein